MLVGAVAVGQSVLGADNPLPLLLQDTRVRVDVTSTLPLALTTVICGLGVQISVMELPAGLGISVLGGGREKRQGLECWGQGQSPAEIGGPLPPWEVCGEELP